MKKLLLVTLLVSIHTVSHAMTVGVESFVCPLDNQQFEARVNYSGTSFGIRLDSKPLGPHPAPWLLPTCPKCGFPLFKDDFSKEDIVKYRSFVTSDAFKEYVGDHPSYFLLAKVKEFDKAPPDNIAYTYVQASWQVENESEEKYKSYLSLALENYLAFMKTAEKKDERWVNASIMIGEVERQLGNFEAALTHFKKLQGETIEKEMNIEKALFKKIIEQEIDLCQKKISSPQALEQ